MGRAPDSGDGKRESSSRMQGGVGFLAEDDPWGGHPPAPRAAGLSDGDWPPPVEPSRSPRSAAVPEPRDALSPRAADSPALQGYPGGIGVEARRDAATKTLYSPWQRALTAWWDAGIDWHRGHRPPHADRSHAAVTAPADPPVPAGRSPRHPRRLRRPLIVGVALLAAVGLAATGLFAFGGTPRRHSVELVAQAADQMFPAPPQAGTDQGLNAVAAAGATVVVAGDEFGGAYARAQFLVSVDGGRTWRLAPVTRAGGGDPEEGGAPVRVIAGEGAWLALGAGNRVAWTSRDGRSWTRLPDTAGFTPTDAVYGVARTPQGTWLAVGATTPSGPDSRQAALWSSPDGVTWRRLGGVDPAARWLDQVSVHAGVVLTAGVVKRTRTVQKDKRKIHQDYDADGFWRSVDGGTTWQPVGLPQDTTGGTHVGLAATPGGFVVVRPGQDARGNAAGIVLASPDGASWTRAGAITTRRRDDLRILRVSGSDDGLAAVGRIADGRTLVYRSADGGTWTQVADLGADDARQIRGVAVTTAGAIVLAGAWSGDSRQPYLGVIDADGAHTVDLRQVPGATHHDLAVDALLTAGGTTLAVGSAGGDAAIWTSTDDVSWRRGAGRRGGVLSRVGRDRLVAATYGSLGWLAVGVTADPTSRPLIVSSPDGQTWDRRDDAPAFVDVADVDVTGVAYGRSGYVVVANRHGAGASPATWRSDDLQSWQAGGGELAGPGTRWIRDLVAVPSGYLAVGGVSATGGADAFDGSAGTPAQPAVWTSPDGVSWKLTTLPVPPGFRTAHLSRVVGDGTRLVALGTAADAAGRVFAVTSQDGGATWQPPTLLPAAPAPGATPPSSGPVEARVTAAVHTPVGYVVAGQYGHDGGYDAVVWVSADGRAWRRVPAAGLTGPGVQRINALTVCGDRLIGLGFTADQRDERLLGLRVPLVALAPRD